MRSIPSILLGAILALGAHPAGAQQQVHFIRETLVRPLVVEDQPIVDQVRGDLTKLRAAQEAYFAANQTYAGDLAELGITPSAGTSLIILTSGPTGWTAEASHPSLLGAEIVQVLRTNPGEPPPVMMRPGSAEGSGLPQGAGLSSLDRGSPQLAQAPPTN